MALEGSPGFPLTSLRGNYKPNGVPDFNHQLPITRGGVIGALPVGVNVAEFGCVVSTPYTDKHKLVLGFPAASQPAGVLIYNPKIAVNDPAMSNGYFEGRPATIMFFGAFWINDPVVDTALMPEPTFGAQVIANNITGKIGFIDFNDTVPTGYTKIKAAVIEIGGPNGTKVFLGIDSTVVDGVGQPSFGAATITANPAAGTVAVGTKVALTTAVADAEIYYTLDGTAPKLTSTLYLGPIEINTPLTIRAIAVAPGYIPTAFSAAYTV